MENTRNAPREVKIDVPPRTSDYEMKQTAGRSDFVYVNSAYVGSLNSVNQSDRLEPPTSVYREQYWACSRWPHSQRILAIAVGVLLGAVISLAVSMALRGGNADGLGIFRTHSAPD